MRIDHRIALVLMIPLMACGHGNEVDVMHPVATSVPPYSAAVYENGPASYMDHWEVDLVQRTCALYVAVRSGSLESPVAFGRAFEDDMVRWNKCPSGTMVACATVSTTDDDNVPVGIPWSHHGDSGL
jgi:hypothetical protein